MTAKSLYRAFAQLATPLIADAALRLKIPFRISPSCSRPVTPNQPLPGRRCRSDILEGSMFSWRDEPSIRAIYFGSTFAEAAAQSKKRTGAGLQEVQKLFGTWYGEQT